MWLPSQLYIGKWGGAYDRNFINTVIDYYIYIISNSNYYCICLNYCT